MSYLNFIGGEWIPALSGDTFENRNPADRSDLIGLFPDGGAADVAAAVDTVSAAWPDWAARGPEARADVLYKAADIISERIGPIAAELTREEGKTLTEARNETGRIAANFRFYAGEALRLRGETYPMPEGQVALSLREPVGVVAVITPWNFPLSMAARKIAPALAAGNGVIFKPSEMTPLMGQRLVEVLLDAGLPQGLLALIQGRGPGVGKAITATPGIDALTFTGSYAVGAQIAKALTTDTRCQLEMGGKNATIVLDDADLDRAAAIIRRGAFGLTGQACTGTSRVLVARRHYAALVDRLTAAAEGIAIGAGTREGIDMGPLATGAQLEKVKAYLGIAAQEGGRITTGGVPDASDAPGDGFFVRPTVVSDLPADSRLLRDEIFAPVVAVRAVEDVDEAIAIADDTEYGLAVSVVSNDLAAVLRLAGKTRHGVVKVNSPTTGVALNAPFGGFKHSSNQSAKEQGGANVMDFYSRIKSVYLGG
ncbi:aldehyde dehydrogenase family protein [Celeribacter indicus]|uniref:Aldehyde dehydrogenase n=1 Tax=Celeribacter indicus TaxID=1208324 RepID=A0A0B5E0E6_9RHOB|nr:aldehyde dehydrogenase family protein [Celeribacter indicus]AJE46885.1 aldehyde dehydrogenase [Celeribacter indicus]SDW79476.1 aldehyde dehydrogenase (NAD+) [Celeribacter indicus]